MSRNYGKDSWIFSWKCIGRKRILGAGNWHFERARLGMSSNKIAKTGERRRKTCEVRETPVKDSRRQDRIGRVE